MLSIDQHREGLNHTALEMLELCVKQLENAREAFFNHDSDLAEEVIRTENRVNSLELKIDKDSERFIALHHPVASDLRFVLALQKITFNLERVGDLADGIARYIVDVDTKIDQRLLELIKINEMFDSAMSIFEDIAEAYTEADTKRARKVFKKDKVLNKINMQAFKTIAEEVKKEPNLIEQFLLLFSILKKLERIGDHCTNIAEEIIFFHEAEILKHKKKKKG